MSKENPFWKLLKKTKMEKEALEFANQLFFATASYKAEDSENGFYEVKAAESLTNKSNQKKCRVTITVTARMWEE